MIQTGATITMKMMKGAMIMASVPVGSIGVTRVEISTSGAQLAIDAIRGRRYHGLEGAQPHVEPIEAVFHVDQAAARRRRIGRPRPGIQARSVTHRGLRIEQP